MIALCHPLGGVADIADITIACFVLPEHVQKRNYCTLPLNVHMGGHHLVVVCKLAFALY